MTLLAAGTVLTGCMVGPDFVPPVVTPPQDLLKTAGTESAASKVRPGADISPEWWHLLHDTTLDRLIAQVAAQNLDVLSATARIQESRAQRGIVAADLFPQIDGNASYTRQKISDRGEISLIKGSGSGSTSGSTGGGSAMGGSQAGIPSSSPTPPFNVYQYGFDASWELDLWGRVRRGVESADASLKASQDDRRQTLVSAIAELVSDYVQLRGTQADMATARDNLLVAQEIDALAIERAKAGLSNQLDVANAGAQAASISAQLPQLEQEQEKQMNAIALLLGEPPGALKAELLAPGPVPPVPPSVPVGVSSELARRRPDIREAEEQLHAATAQIGVAKADFFPKVTLMGNGELQALTFSQLNTWAARSYSFGPSVTLPVFEGGRLTATLALRNDQQKEAALAYRKTVLGAFHEVDNALTAYGAEQTRRQSIVIELGQNREALHLATELYRQGLGTFIDVLNAERTLLATEQQNIDSTQTESLNMVQLYKALGGGWETAFPEKSPVKR